MNKKKYPVVNIGTTSILTVFVILCMVTFAALSLLTANRNARYNDQVQERTEATIERSIRRIRKSPASTAPFRNTGQTAPGNRQNLSMPSPFPSTRLPNFPSV